MFDRVRWWPDRPKLCPNRIMFKSQIGSAGGQRGSGVGWLGSGYFAFIVIACEQAIAEGALPAPIRPGQIR